MLSAVSFCFIYKCWGITFTVYGVTEQMIKPHAHMTFYLSSGILENIRSSWKLEMRVQNRKEIKMTMEELWFHVVAEWLKNAMQRNSMLFFEGKKAEFTTISMAIHFIRMSIVMDRVFISISFGQYYVFVDVYVLEGNCRAHQCKFRQFYFPRFRNLFFLTYFSFHIRSEIAVTRRIRISLSFRH